MADNEFVSLSITEDRLTADKKGEYKKELLEQLNAELATIKSKRNTGLSPNDFACADAIINAIDEAIKVVELTWHKHHMTDKAH